MKNNKINIKIENMMQKTRLIVYNQGSADCQANQGGQQPTNWFMVNRLPSNSRSTDHQVNPDQQTNEWFRVNRPPSYSGSTYHQVNQGQQSPKWFRVNRPPSDSGSTDHQVIQGQQSTKWFRVNSSPSETLFSRKFVTRNIALLQSTGNEAASTKCSFR